MYVRLHKTIQLKLVKYLLIKDDYLLLTASFEGLILPNTELVACYRIYAIPANPDLYICLLYTSRCV